MRSGEVWWEPKWAETDPPPHPQATSHRPSVQGTNPSWLAVTTGGDLPITTVSVKVWCIGDILKLRIIVIYLKFKLNWVSPSFICQTWQSYFSFKTCLWKNGKLLCWFLGVLHHRVTSLNYLAGKTTWRKDIEGDPGKTTWKTWRGIPLSPATQSTLPRL